jgi:hypothetical protein
MIWWWNAGSSQIMIGQGSKQSIIAIKKNMSKKNCGRNKTGGRAT